MELSNLETPCFILKEQELKNNILGFKEALQNNFPSNILSYSVKTNSFPKVLETILELGGYAEVVSHDEYEWAKLNGFQLDKIVYNGPAKDKVSFIEALNSGTIVNIETNREIEWLKDLDQAKQYNVGIRLNIDLGLISKVDSKDNEDYSRFGFSFESGDFKRAIDKIGELNNIVISGLHVHRTSATRSIDMYRNIAKYVGVILKQCELKLSYLDIGGGFYGIMKGKPTYEEYCQAIREELSQFIALEAVTIIVEPGNAIVASAFDFLVSVIDKKNIRDFTVITTDGSRNDIDPFFRKTGYFYELIKNSGNASKTKDIQQINGCSCLEYDKMFEIHNEEELNIGDKIWFKSVGAYTMTMSPLFIRLFPNVYFKQEEGISLLRAKWDAKSLGYNYLK